MSGLFSKENLIAPPGFNRWKVPPASIGIHLCIGSVYAWSIYNPVLIKSIGVVGSAPDDWSLKSVVWVFTVAIVFLGLSAALAGKWLEKVGPRLVGVTAACCWGGGIIVGGVGIWLHQLWLLYLGYGVIGGIGLGLGYVSPVTTLVRWFPDRRGMATGMAIMGFGGGAMIGAPLKEFLIRFFYRAPEYLGTVGDVDLVTREGVRFAHVGGALKEVLVVGANDVGNMIVPGPEGVYLVGTGQSGVAAAFFVLGSLYFLVMVVASFAFRVPAPDWQPSGWTPPTDNEPGQKMISTNHVHMDQAMKTPQFYLLWLVLCLNVTAGIGVLGVAKTMMKEIFGSTLPDVATSAFAGTYVIMISVFNMGGRFFWSTISDYIGRKNTFHLFFVLGILLYLSIPFTTWMVSIHPAVKWLVIFYAATMLIFTMYGGSFATIAAYLADIFGTKHLGGIYGRLLTAWSTAGVLGPLAITTLRDYSRMNAIRDLAGKVAPVDFEGKFGADISQLELLVKQKTVTISKLMEIAPPGTVDPSANLYTTTMYLMAGLLGIALIANVLIRPVDPSHHLSEEAG